MTRLPNTNLVQRLQRVVNAGFFGDTAVLIQATSSSYDAAGQPVETDTETEFKCSFTDKPSRELWRDFADIEQIDAEIRYTGTKASKGDRIRLVSRFDRDTYASNVYTPQTFEVIDIRDRDAFGYVAALREVQV